MKEQESDEVHELALELHDLVSKATRHALRELPDGSDHTLGRRVAVSEEALRFLERQVLEIAADLFDLSGERDQAQAVRGHVDEAVTLTESARQSSRVCEGCGCTDFIGCPGGCSWVAASLCSRCHGRRNGKARSPAARRARR